MKKLLSIAVIFLMFFVGCSNEVNINSPIENQANGEGTEKVLINLDALNAPEEADPEIDTSTVSNVKVINGTTGGEISVIRNVVNSSGEIVQINAKFNVTPGAFSGIQTISMKVNVDSAFVTFSPAMNFNQYCKLDIEFRNVNLANLGYTPSTPSAYFVYFDNWGMIWPNINGGVTYDYNQGVLKVTSAKIYHFSRYGFVRSAV